jgi:hypothetical protein
MLALLNVVVDVVEELGNPNVAFNSVEICVLAEGIRPLEGDWSGFNHDPVHPRLKLNLNLNAGWIGAKCQTHEVQHDINSFPVRDEA